MGGRIRARAHSSVDVHLQRKRSTESLRSGRTRTHPRTQDRRFNGCCDQASGTTCSYCTHTGIAAMHDVSAGLTLERAHTRRHGHMELVTAHAVERGASASAEPEIVSKDVLLVGILDRPPLSFLHTLCRHWS